MGQLPAGKLAPPGRPGLRAVKRLAVRAGRTQRGPGYRHPLGHFRQLERGRLPATYPPTPGPRPPGSRPASLRSLPEDAGNRIQEPTRPGYPGVTAPGPHRPCPQAENRDRDRTRSRLDEPDSTAWPGRRTLPAGRAIQPGFPGKDRTGRYRGGGRYRQDPAGPGIYPLRPGPGGRCPGRAGFRNGRALALPAAFNGPAPPPRNRERPRRPAGRPLVDRAFAPAARTARTLSRPAATRQPGRSRGPRHPFRSGGPPFTGPGRPQTPASIDRRFAVGR